MILTVSAAVALLGVGVAIGVVVGRRGNEHTATVSTSSPQAFMTTIGCSDPVPWDSQPEPSAEYRCQGGTSSDFIYPFACSSEEQLWLRRTAGIDSGTVKVAGPGWVVSAETNAMAGAAIDAGGSLVN